VTIPPTALQVPSILASPSTSVRIAASTNLPFFALLDDLRQRFERLERQARASRAVERRQAPPAADLARHRSASRHRRGSYRRRARGLRGAIDGLGRGIGAAIDRRAPSRRRPQEGGERDRHQPSNVPKAWISATIAERALDQRMDRLLGRDDAFAKARAPC
jgi:hypothetical protein